MEGKMKTKKTIISFILIIGIMLLSACFIPNSGNSSYSEDMEIGTGTVTIRLPGSTVFANINGFNYAHGTGGTNVVLGSNNNVPINMQRYADYKYI